MSKLLFYIILISIIALLVGISTPVITADAHLVAPHMAKLITPTPTADVLAYQSSGYGMSIMGIVLFIIFAGGLLFGYWRITH